MGKERLSQICVDEVDEQRVDGHSAELRVRVARRCLRCHVDKIQHMLDTLSMQYSRPFSSNLIQRCNLGRYLIQRTLEVHPNDGILARVLPELLNRVQFEDLLTVGQDAVEPLDVGDDLLNRDVLAYSLSEVVNPLLVVGVMLVVGLTSLRVLSLHAVCILQ